ncbi:MAG TPA: hypothetical protein VFK10_04470 [Burkholderiaceae bacterium]|nr:hypothetical protein [Burkholderiaceae bacterium]
MTAQWVTVAIIVPLCTLYAVWNLLGATARRRVSSWLASRPWPAAWQRRLAKMGADASACGCDGCDNKPEPARPDEPTQAIVRVHRRRS